MRRAPLALAGVSSALHALASEGQVLPATGQAIVDLARPDIDELYDQHSGAAKQIEGLYERPSRSLYRSLQPIDRGHQHLFRYFVDGSTRMYFIGTILEHERSSPVQIAQVGAAGVHRDDDGRIRVVGVRSRTALLMDRRALSDQLWTKVASVAQAYPGLVVQSTGDDDEYTNLGANEPRSRGSHKANWLMRQAERELAQVDIGHRKESEWLVIDGSLGNEYLDWRGGPVIGVAKTFRRDHTFQLGSGPQARTLNLFSLLSDLGDNQRTAVFPRRKEGRSDVIAFWYVRLRPQKGLDYPLMGVVKVEMPATHGEPLDTALVDEVSSCLLAERNVTPHGLDSRWHAHLYPVSLAERVIKGSFYSEEVLKAAIKWPTM